MNDRAVQFLPFASLRGYYDVINERKKIKEPKRELSEEAAALLNEKLGKVKKNTIVKVTYYLIDAYETVEGIVADFDDVYRTLTIVKTVIPFDDIFDVGGEEIDGTGEFID